jgi:hypothetical protein
MHAPVVTVDIANFENARKALMEEVVPRVSKAPGFLKGYWTVRSDTTQGLSFLVFDTKEHAVTAPPLPSRSERERCATTHTKNEA